MENKTEKRFKVGDIIIHYFMTSDPPILKFITKDNKEDYIVGLGWSKATKKEVIAWYKRIYRDLIGNILSMKLINDKYKDININSK